MKLQFWTGALTRLFHALDKMYQHCPPSFVMILCSPSSLWWLIWPCRYPDSKKEVCGYRICIHFSRPQKVQPPVWINKLAFQSFSLWDFGLCDTPHPETEFLKLSSWAQILNGLCWAVTALGVLVGSLWGPSWAGTRYPRHLWRSVEQ